LLSLSISPLLLLPLPTINVHGSWLLLLCGHTWVCRTKSKVKVR
jgi:hypothetical protein